jgi:spore germination cell wall hydrolase CwlJ-like protein
MIPNSDLTALALTMLGEARGEGLEGMQDVGSTIINRVNHPSWRGDTVLGVCVKPWQYSCWNEGDPNREYLDSIEESDELYQKSANIAEDLIDETLADRTNGATYYYRIGSPEPKWAIGKDPCFTSDHHVFFKDIA